LSSLSLHPKRGRNDDDGQTDEQRFFTHADQRLIPQGAQNVMQLQPNQLFAGQDAGNDDNQVNKPCTFFPLFPSCFSL
jgi:hypothetical protein